MLKNILETKEGKRMAILSVIGLFFVVVIIFFSLFAGEKTGNEATAESQDNQKNSRVTTSSEYAVRNAVVYQGTWYSNRSDDMIVELKSDGSYTASDWLSKGTYSLTGDTMVLKDDKQGSKKFKLQTKSGQTVMYLNEDNEEIYLYPNQELLKESENQQEEIDEDLTNLVNQKWSDVLYQNSWESKTGETTFTITFYQDKYVQVKEEPNGQKESHTFNYRIVSQEVEEEKSTYQISRTSESGEVDEVTFTVSEGDSTYELAGNTGTFLWVPSYEKLKSEVQLTQDGTTKEDAPLETTVMTDENGKTVTITEETAN